MRLGEPVLQHWNPGCQQNPWDREMGQIQLCPRPRQTPSGSPLAAHDFSKDIGAICLSAGHWWKSPTWEPMVTDRRWMKNMG